MPARIPAAKDDRRDHVGGQLEVGVNDTCEVVINHPKLDLDENGCGYFVFSPNQARRLSLLLKRKADEADEQYWEQRKGNADQNR